MEDFITTEFNKILSDLETRQAQDQQNTTTQQEINLPEGMQIAPPVRRAANRTSQRQERMQRQTSRPQGRNTGGY